MDRSGFTVSYVTLVVVFCLSLQMSGCVLLVAGAVSGAAAGTAASVKASDEEHSPLAYVGAVLVNVVYFPAKVVFAAAGAVTSGMAYLLTGGGSQPAAKIWDTSVKGNYVMTPSMVEGEAPVHFTGNA